MKYVIPWFIVFLGSLIGGFWKRWLWYITAVVFFGPLAGVAICARVKEMVRLKRLYRRKGR